MPATIITPNSEVLAIQIGGRIGFVQDASDSGETITVPGAALTVLDSALITAFKSILWHLEMVKGTNTYSSYIHANHDGTTPSWVENGLILAPAAGTFDFTTNVDISGGSIRLTVTPATTGWTAHTRRISELTA